ncbi:MAG: HPr(Ser) kinase/phosphatase [Gammaproteobacteria bacterium]|nr:MAG: HPr(Ser) kinase/phosphatase [Gammaproteobacteria bacterium]
MKDIITANHIFESHVDKFKIKWLAGKKGGERTVSSQEDNKNKYPLIGYLNLIRPNRIQIIGQHELFFLDNLTLQNRVSLIKELFDPKPTILIFCDNLNPPPDIMDEAEKTDTPLWKSSVSSFEIMSVLQYELIDQLANKVTIHGVLMDIFGMGVLITGKSGIGKSELALDLISRGHSLIADDAPEFTRIGPDTLCGSCPETIRNMLEVRGIGLLDIKAMFGDSAVQQKKNLRLIVDMQPSENISYDADNRLEGVRRETKYLDVTIPEVKIPVAPGRNLAVITEACVRDHMLREEGHVATDRFNAKLHQKIQEGKL